MCALFFYTLCALCLQHVHSQVSLTETGGGVKKPGESLRLSCKGSGLTFSRYGMSWVRQQPGRGLEWVAYSYDSSRIYYSPSLKDRTTISRDNSQSLLYVDMTNLKPEDTGTYYCARDGLADYFDVWGPGTYVAVTSATPSGPSVYPVSPCCDVQKSQDPLKIGCFVTADSPSDNIQWFLGSSQISSGVTQYPEVYSNGRYSLSSVLNLKSADWNDKSYECRFGTQKKPVQKRGCKEDCPNKIPKIELYMASCEPDDPKNMYLFCDLSDFAPEDIEVAWFRGTSTVTDFITIGNVTEVNKCSFHTSSKLKLVPEDWSNGMEYKCLATHSTKSVEKKISSCTACPKPSPTIELMKSSYRDFFTKKKGTLTCNVTSFLKNTIVILKQDNRDLVKKQLSSSEATGNGTWNVHISFDISKADWRKTFICEAQHTCKTDKKTLNPEETKEQKKPSVKIHKAVSSIFNTLICIISGYYPDEIFVKWEQNGHPGNTEASTHPAVYDKASKSYTMQSILLIPIEDVKEASIWSCMVGHSALSEMMSDSTEVKPFAQPKVPPTVAISEPSADENNEQRLNIDCIAYGFFPKNIAIQWLSQEPKKLLVKTFDVELGESGTYSIKSILNLSKEEWHEGQFTCDVKHEATKTRILRNTTNTHECSTECPKCPECLNCTECPKCQNCTKCPECKNCTECPECKKCTECPECKNCTECPEYTKYQECINCTECSTNKTEPIIHIVKPSCVMSVITKKTNLTCLIIGYMLSNINITWTVEDKVQLHGVYMDTSDVHPDGTGTVKSNLEVLTEDLFSNKTYTCMASYPSLKAPMMAKLDYPPTFSKNVQESKHPAVNIYMSSPNVKTPEDNLTLICLAEKFSNNVSVQWMEDGKPINSSDSFINSIHYDWDTTLFTATSKLFVWKQQKENIGSYTCIAGSRSSTWNITKPRNVHSDNNTIPEVPYYIDCGPETPTNDELNNIWRTTSAFICLFIFSFLYSTFVTLIKVHSGDSQCFSDNPRKTMELLESLK